MGLFPNAWLPVINFVNVILQLIVWTLLAFSLTKLLFKRSLATMNIGEKIALMDGMKNKISMIGDASQEKLQDTMQKIVNDSNGGLVCIII